VIMARTMATDSLRSDPSVLILGAGYTGQALIPLLEQSGYHPVATRRGSGSLRSRDEGTQTLRFDLSREESWDGIPECWGCAWLFPADPPDAADTFGGLLLSRTDRLVVIGTTSSYHQTREDELLTEEARLDRTLSRVEGEERLRARGANILRSAGIYGSGRNPLDWLRRGMIPAGEKYLNLVHVLDLASTIITALESNVRGRQYIVTDGTPRQWKEIAAWAMSRGYIQNIRYGGGVQQSSRRLSNKRLLDELKPHLLHTDLFAEMEDIEEASRRRHTGGE
jgi:nucleoside-diphosphate-sugar epimerase